jgi:hypothetical protein
VGGERKMKGNDTRGDSRTHPKRGPSPLATGRRLRDREPAVPVYIFIYRRRRIRIDYYWWLAEQDIYYTSALIQYTNTHIGKDVATINPGETLKASQLSSTRIKTKKNKNIHTTGPHGLNRFCCLSFFLYVKKRERDK